MFFVRVFTHAISLGPQYIGGNMHELVKKHLVENVESTCTPYGFVISVLQIFHISEGFILLNGCVRFHVRYEALVLNPIKGEVLEATIISSNKMGFFAAVGPLSVFISTYQIPNNILNSISINDIVRLRIIGTKIDSTKIYSIGTLNEESLGLVI